MIAPGDSAKRGSQRLVVELGQRPVDIARLAQVRLGDRSGWSGLDVLPQLIADHLELYRLDVLTGDGSLLAGDTHLAQVVHELLGHAWCKGPAGQCRWATDGVKRGCDAHAFHVEACPQTVEHQGGVGVERRDVVLAQREHDPQVRVPEQRSVQLPEEFAPFLPAPWVRSDDLLELVDDQHEGLGRRAWEGPALGMQRNGLRFRVIRPALAVLGNQVRQELAQREVGSAAPGHALGGRG